MSTGDETIKDFGEQFQAFPFSGKEQHYYNSLESLQDVFGPLLSVNDIKGKRVADIGSGPGRNVLLLAKAQAAHVVAVEPSAGFEQLQRNTAQLGSSVTLIHGRGETIPSDLGLDYVFSPGVIHHIPEPQPVMRACLRALRPGGSMLVWLYGREGNGFYLAWMTPLRFLSTHLPHFALHALTKALLWSLNAYVAACKRVPLPMRTYMLSLCDKLTDREREMIIYDQLKPAYAKYYTQAEARALLEDAGFTNVRLWHRHGFSWTVIGQKPSA